MFNVGDVVARYRIVDFIQRGGSALVYKARNLQSTAIVALKVVDWGPAHDAADLIRLRKDAAAVTALDNAHICAVHAIEPANGQLLIEMEFLEGRSLDLAMGAAPFDAAVVVDYARQIAAAFEAAHDRGLLHLDFKPSKVMLTAAGLKVLDFGLGWMLHRGREAKPATADSRIGAVLSYASPEHVLGRPLDQRSDLFCLGTVLYEMSAGVAPFTGAQLPDVIQRIVSDAPQPVGTRNPAVPDMLVRIIRRLLEKDPAARYQSASALRADLESLALPLATPPSRPAAAAPVAPPLTAVGRYEIVRPLATSQMADVYLAHDTQLDRAVAVKLLNGATDARARRLFLAEARAVARLRHPNIVAIFDIGEIDGRPFIAMEYVEGTTLGEMIAGRRPPADSAILAYIGQACRGLDYAHRLGIVHRDIKPGNIIVGADGVVRILDFGIAQWAASAGALDGAIAGTAGYMAPETVRGDMVDRRADIFAAGAVLFELLTGRKAFPQASLPEYVHALLNGGAPSVESVRPDLDPGICAVVNRCLAADPAQRFQTMEEVETALLGAAAMSRAAGDRMPLRSGAPPRAPEPITAVVRREARPVPPPAPAAAPADDALSVAAAPAASRFSLPLPTLARTGTKTRVSPTADVQFCDRTLDLAVPPAVPVLTPIELIALLRRPGSPSLAALLEADGEEEPRRTRSRTFAMEFPLVGGAMRPAVVTMRVTAPDFTPPHLEKTIRVRPDADAARQTFLLTPNVQGTLRIQFDLLAEDNVSLASRAIETQAGPSDRPATPPRVIASVPLEVTVLRRRFLRLRRVAAAVALAAIALAGVPAVAALLRSDHGTRQPQSLAPQPARRSVALTTPRAPAPAAVVRGPSYALIIGIDRYAALPALQTAVNDARAVETVLRAQYGFHTELLLDASRFEIISALNRYRTTLTPGTSLLIYYAGHGSYDKDADKAYWMPADAEPDVTANWIIADEITSAIKVVPSRHVLVVSDSCYSGGLSRDSAPAFTPQERDRFLDRMEAGVSRTLLASGGNEPVADGGGGDGHSVFASALIRALEAPERTTFTGQELFASYVGVAVAGQSQQTPQYSVIRNSGHDSGDFVFVRNAAR